MPSSECRQPNRRVPTQRHDILRPFYCQVHTHSMFDKTINTKEIRQEFIEHLHSNEAAGNISHLREIAHCQNQTCRRTPACRDPRCHAVVLAYPPFRHSTGCPRDDNEKCTITVLKLLSFFCASKLAAKERLAHTGHGPSTLRLWPDTLTQ